MKPSKPQHSLGSKGVDVVREVVQLHRLDRQLHWDGA